MAVSSNLTSLEDFDPTTSATYNDIGSGQGAGDNTDAFIENAVSGGRRVDNATDKGFMATITSTDLSGAGEHIKMWMFCFHWSAVTAVSARVASGAAAYDNHTFPAANIPVTGGWIPLWLDVSRTPESTAASGLNEAAVTDIGAYITIGNVGGAGDNWILDEIMHGTTGLLWSGTGGDMADFRTFESTNVEGNLIPRDGVDYVFSRLTIGDASQTVFTDSGLLVVFPDQVLVADTFMGITCDLQATSTAITFNDSTIASSNVASATKRPDLVVTSTTGTFDSNNTNWLGMRTVDLTSACTIDGGVIETVNLTQSGADISNCTLRPNTASQVAMCDDPTFAASADLNNLSIVQAGSGHALELTSSGARTFTGITFSGFGGTPGSNLVENSGDNAAALLNSSGSAITITIAGGGNSPSVRNTGSGSTTTIVNLTQITLTGLVNGTEVRVYDAGDQSVIDGIESVTGNQFSFSDTAANVVDIRIFKEDYLPADIEGYTIPASDTSIPIQQTFDRNYRNP